MPERRANGTRFRPEGGNHQGPWLANSRYGASKLPRDEELLTKLAQEPDVANKEPLCDCSKSEQQVQTKEPEESETIALVPEEESKNAVKKAGKKYKVITITIPVDGEEADIASSAAAAIASETLASGESSLKEEKADEELEAPKPDELIEKDTLEGVEEEVTKVKETSYKKSKKGQKQENKVDKKRSKRDAKGKREAKGKKSSSSSRQSGEKKSKKGKK